MGKKIQNHSEIAQVAMAEEHSAPIRIIYVKPGLNKPQS